MTTTRPPAFACPACGSSSHHPDDVRNGYCPTTHSFPGRPPQGPPPVQVHVNVPQAQAPQKYTTQGQMSYGQSIFHWVMMICTCGLWIPVYLSARRKRRSVTRAH